MARNTMDFAQQNTERAVQATDWMRAIAEQNLNQSKAAFEGLLTIARNAVRGDDHQAAFIRGSMMFAEETLSNTFDFAHKLVRESHRNSLRSRPSSSVGKLRSWEIKPKSSGKGSCKEYMTQQRPHWKERYNHPKDNPRPHEANESARGGIFVR
jgi:hypothetical protein